MKKDQIQDIILGVAVVALGYAIWQHFKDRMPMKSTIPTTFTKNDPTQPDHGFGYDPYAPAEFLTVDQLVKGTIADRFTGTKAAEEIPTTSGLIDSASKEFYGVQEQPGDFMKVGYW